VSEAKISFQVVARDADLVIRLLEHHQGLWDEAVVVDTGDGSVAEAAAKAGAIVVRQPLDGDFAAVRNAALAAATGEMILLLDTDELIAQQDFKRLRQALSNRDTLYVMSSINYHWDARHPEWRPLGGDYPEQEKGQTGCFRSRRVNVFPRRKGLIFHGRVHETILSSPGAADLAVRDLDVPIHHYGYVLDPAINQDRARRYAKLVRDKLADQPDDPGALLEMATVFIEEGQIPAARELLAKLTARTLVDSAVTRGRFLLGRLLREEKRFAEAESLLSRAVEEDPRLLFCWLEWIRALADRQSWIECQRVLTLARARFGAEPLLDKEELRLLIKTGRIQEASAVVARLRKVYPDDGQFAGLAGKLQNLLGKMGLGH